MTEQQYIDYFEGLATRHKAILHNAETHKSFFVVHDDNLTEVETAVRNSLSLPALLLDQYFDEEDTEHDNNRLRVLGGLSIICKTEAGNTQSFREARQEARRIARRILNKVRKDCRYGGALFDQNVMISFQAQGEPTPIIGGSATGWGYAFTLLKPMTVAIDGDDWLE
ncbi:hypothetical protein IC229_05860 [Spirosoma sp. BT702]|uniref:Uncharacterized protein n=1 Tax=Spirosoma profusum TaxID=2771354 RepID=A0A927AQD6_9BACT|nr:hypothetical protein [Spirosoma profusum]MBD2700151.1 hypothetical protein [Spirosoma profusum]